MNLNPFTWIAERTRRAVQAGFAAGLSDIGALDDVPDGSPLAALQERMRALPAAEPELPEKGKKK